VVIWIAAPCNQPIVFHVVQQAAQGRRLHLRLPRQFQLIQLLFARRPLQDLDGVQRRAERLQVLAHGVGQLATGPLDQHRQSIRRFFSLGHKTMLETIIVLSTIPRSRAAGLLLIGLLGCTESKAKVTPPPPTVTVARVVRQDVALYIEAVGNVDGFVNAEIRARVRGILQAQRYKDGAAVKQGQLLFSIDRSEYQASADAAKAALARAQTAAAHNKAMLERRTDLSAA